MTLPLLMIRESDVPLYLQIRHQVRHLIISQTLKEGDLLPSIRILAAQLNINPNTVAQAYRELTNDGLITTRQGQGTFVNAFTSSQPNSDTKRLQLLTELLTCAHTRSLSMGFTTGDFRDNLNAVLAQPAIRHLVVVTKNQAAATRYRELLNEQLDTRMYSVTALTFHDIDTSAPEAQRAFKTGYFALTLSLYVRELEALLSRQNIPAQVIPATVDITQPLYRAPKSLIRNPARHSGGRKPQLT